MPRKTERPITRNTKPNTRRRTQDDAPAPDLEALRAELAQRLHAIVNEHQWPGCPDAPCRRQRRCMAAAGRCANPRPAPVLTAAEKEQAIADLRQGIRARLAELGAREA